MFSVHAHPIDPPAPLNRNLLKIRNANNTLLNSATCCNDVLQMIERLVAPPVLMCFNTASRAIRNYSVAYRCWTDRCALEDVFCRNLRRSAAIIQWHDAIVFGPDPLSLLASDDDFFGLGWPDGHLRPLARPGNRGQFAVSNCGFLVNVTIGRARQYQIATLPEINAQWSEPTATSLNAYSLCCGRSERFWREYRPVACGDGLFFVAADGPKPQFVYYDLQSSAAQSVGCAQTDLDLRSYETCRNSRVVEMWHRDGMMLHQIDIRSRDVREQDAQQRRGLPDDFRLSCVCPIDEHLVAFGLYDARFYIHRDDPIVNTFWIHLYDRRAARFFQKECTSSWHEILCMAALPL